jgi:hypothetical protein
MSADFEHPNSDDAQGSGEINVERWAIELDEFVRDVSSELSGISRDLGQAIEIRVATRPEESIEPPANIHRPEKQGGDEQASRLQSIRDRLARVARTNSENTGGTGSHE